MKWAWLPLAATLISPDGMRVCNEMQTNPGVVLHRVLYAVTASQTPPVGAQQYPGVMAESFVARGGCADVPAPTTPGAYWLHLRYEYSGPGDGDNSVQVATQPFRVALAGFYTVEPCRVFDTRVSLKDAPEGQSPYLWSGQERVFAVGGKCQVPLGATAVAANVTVVRPTSSGFLVVWPEGTPRPATSTINFRAGAVRANNAILGLGKDGTVRIAAALVPITTDAQGRRLVMMPIPTVDVILDVVGYFDQRPTVPLGRRMAVKSKGGVGATAGAIAVVAVPVGIAIGFWFLRRKARRENRDGGSVGSG